MSRKNEIAKIVMGGDREKYIGTMIKKKSLPQHRVLMGIPMTGLVRAEWMMARYGQVIPCNWSHVDLIQHIDQYSPISFMVHDARNLIVKEAVEKDFEWLFFLDHDVIIPPDTLLKVSEYLRKGDIPVFCGLYFTRSSPSEPLLYRGKGNGFYDKWKFGDKVWVDGIPMGCTLIHVSILKEMYAEAEEYDAYGTKVRRVFNTPAKIWYDPEMHGWHSEVGTEDIDWCNRVISGRYFDKAGWTEYQEKEFPFMVDTNIFCRHINHAGIQYPNRGEEFEFIPDDVKDHYKKYNRMFTDER